MLFVCVSHPGLAQTDDSSPIELIVRAENDSSVFAQMVGASEPSAALQSDESLRGVSSVSKVYRSSDPGSNREALSIPTFRVAVQDSASLRRVLEDLRDRPDVQYAHPNVRFSLHGRERSSEADEDPPVLAGNVFADSLNHLSVVRALEAWTETPGTSEVEIGIVDTGIYLDHPDLSDQFAINEAEDLNGNGQFDPYPASEGGDLNGKDDDGNGYVDDVVGYDFVDRPRAVPNGDYADRDPDPRPDSAGPGSGHGTAVAGVAAASPEDAEAGVAGVAPGASIVPIRAFGGDGRGRADDIAAAIVYGASIGVDVLNLSFGREEPVPVIEEAIEYATEQGTIVVASAGNELTDAPHYPSDYPEVVSVVWLAEDGEGLPEFNRSQYGIGVDLGAPGTNVFSTRFPREALDSDDPPRSTLYGSNTGSSFSAPQVAGAAALLRSADSSLSPAALRSILTATAADLNADAWDVRTGAGRLDLRDALHQAYPARTELTSPEHNSGTVGDAPLPILGSVLDAAFEEYALYYAEGTRDLDRRPDPWKEIQSPVASQQYQDTLGTWDVQSLPEGAYTLRLVTRRTDGSTVEDRRRVYVDRTPPSITLGFVGAGRVEGQNGLVADVETDDPTRLELRVRTGSHRDSVRSDATVRRHGLFWPDESGRGGEAEVTITASNPSGLTRQVDTTVTIPEAQENTSLLRRTTTSVPRGPLLPEPTDFDRDGLAELVLNQDRQGGGISDTIRSFEWAGEGFGAADTLIAQQFPRDVGDTDGDGQQELLLQVRGATTLVEQPTPDTFPTRPIFADSTLSSSRISFRGALLADLDADGKDEIVGASDSTEWRVVEHANGTYREAYRLLNPTDTTGAPSTEANTFGAPEAASADFDGDGAQNLLVGDRDGDLIIYEATETGEMEVAWTHETDRVEAGTRFGVGDATGDDRPEFVTVSTTAPEETPEGGRAPRISYYTIWRAVGDDEYQVAYRLPVTDPPVDQGAIEMGDLDGDQRDEIVIAHPPSLLVLDRTDQDVWRVLHENEQSPSILSPEVIVADLSGNGRPSVFAAVNDEALVRYEVDQTSVENAPPRWRTARPRGADTTQLSWRASGADSVEVLAGPPGEAVSPVQTATDSSLRIPGNAARRFVLRAWRDGAASPLSSGRLVRPHDPARVSRVEYPDPTAVELRFTEPLAEDLQPAQFAFEEADRTPNRLIQTEGGSGVLLRFSDAVAGQSGRLQWDKIRDASGLPVDQTLQELSFPDGDQEGLFVEQATIVDERSVALQFSDPVSPADATDPSRYQLRPRGQVEDARMEEDSSRTVLLHVDDLVIGATGRESSLSISDMTSLSGQSLVEDGETVRLTQPADDLDNVFVYPNPYRASVHGESLSIGGLPLRATIRIYTPEGQQVDEFEVEDNRTGGTTWDLRDQRGRRVPSGIYLFRIEAPEQSSVLKKAAIIR